MRTIKFRAWDKETSRFISTEELVFDKKGNIKGIVTNHEEENGTGFYREISRIGLGEFTGLKDKNGKEIYEGDIVRFRGHSWDIDGNHYHPIKTEKIVFEGGAFDCNYRYEEDCYDVGWEEVEVIGNIYENKELLMEGN